MRRVDLICVEEIDSRIDLKDQFVSIDIALLACPSVRISGISADRDHFPYRTSGKCHTCSNRYIVTSVKRTRNVLALSPTLGWRKRTLIKMITPRAAITKIPIKIFLIEAGIKTTVWLWFLSPFDINVRILKKFTDEGILRLQKFISGSNSFDFSIIMKSEPVSNG